MSRHTVSVVILTRNSALTIDKCLRSVFQQTHAPDEVVVVEGGSVDGTLDIVRKYPVKLVEEPGLGYGYARNLGVKNAEGEIVFFIDSDCYAEPSWIERILLHFDDPGIGGVTGSLRLWNIEHGVARFLAHVGGRMNMPSRHIYVKTAPTMNLALRREVILEVGGFDETLVRGEDAELTYKVTRLYKIIYEPQAVIWFRGSSSLRTASKKCVQHFVGAGQLLAKHGFDSKFIRFDLLIRGILLLIGFISLLTLPWYVPATIFTWLLVEFASKMVKLYRRIRDPCIIYYLILFTYWSVSSLAILYGLCLGLKQRVKGRPSTTI